MEKVKPYLQKVLLIGLTISLIALGCKDKKNPDSDSATGSDAKPVIVKLAHPNTPATPMGKGIIRFKELLEQKSAGKFEVQIYDSSKFGNWDSVVQGLQSGVLQMGTATASNLTPFSDKFLLFDLPYFYASYEDADKISDGPIGREIADALVESGILGLGYMELGFRHIWNSKRTVTSLEDARNLTIRSTPSKIHQESLYRLGMKPTPISWTEVFTALQQGTVDGIDIDLGLAYENRFYEVTKYLTITNGIYTPHLVLLSKAFADTLSKENRAMLQSAVDEAKLYERELVRGGRKDYIQKVKDVGVEVYTLPPEERVRWIEATSSIQDEYKQRIGEEMFNAAKETLGR